MKDLLIGGARYARSVFVLSLRKPRYIIREFAEGKELQSTSHKTNSKGLDYTQMPETVWKQDVYFTRLHLR
jgi:hypothetical protein